MAREAMDVCLQLLKERTKVGSIASVSRTVYWSYRHITFQDCRVHNLYRNSCISIALTIEKKLACWPVIFSSFSGDTKRAWNARHARLGNPREKNWNAYSFSHIHYAFRQSTRGLNLGNQNLPIQLKIKHNGWSGTVVSPTSLFANMWGQFPDCFRLISGWENEVVYTCVSLISLLKAKGLVGETTGLCWSTSYMSL